MGVTSTYMIFKAITLADIKGRKSIEKERESRSEHWHTLKLNREELQAKEAKEEGEVTGDETQEVVVHGCQCKKENVLLTGGRSGIKRNFVVWVFKMRKSQHTRVPAGMIQ